MLTSVLVVQLAQTSKLLNASKVKLESPHPAKVLSSYSI
jgi:hypothetical protein